MEIHSREIGLSLCGFQNVLCILIRARTSLIHKIRGMPFLEVRFKDEMVVSMLFILLKFHVERKPY